MVLNILKTEAQRSRRGHIASGWSRRAKPAMAGSSLFLISMCLCDQFWCSGPFSTPPSFGFDEASVLMILSCDDESI